MRVIAVASQKGGVGKTSLVHNIGFECAKKKRVLLIDFDPQANLTMCFDVHPSKDTPTVYNVLKDPELFEKSLIKVRDNLFLMPASMDLSASEVNFATDADRHERLKKVLQNAKNFDMVIIDAPPSLGFFTTNAFTAATEFIIPLQCHGFAWRALDQLFDIVKVVKKRLNPDLQFTGIVLTFHDTRNTLARTVINQAKKQFKDRVFNTPIPINVRVAEAPLKGLAAAEHAPRSTGAKAYKKLAGEVLNGIR